MIGQKGATFTHNLREWKFTINTEATKSGDITTGIPLNLTNQAGVKFIVDWGDGTSNTLTSANYGTNDTRASMHDYAEAGIYQITITADKAHWEKTYLYSKQFSASSSNNSEVCLYWFRRTLLTVDSIIPKVKGCFVLEDTPYIQDNSFNYMFHACEKLTSIPSGLFDNNPDTTSFGQCFYRCTNLQAIPSGLFDKHTNALIFSSCFNSCDSITSIPTGLFDYNTKATRIRECFYGCDNISSIPSGLFANNPNVTDFSFCFYGVYALRSIPAGLFSSNTEVTSFSGCFEYCSALTSIPAELFSHSPKATTFTRCFYHCTGITSIPSGLFVNNPNVEVFEGCFEGCTALTSIPSGLFDSCTKVNRYAFNSCFAGCSKITSIPTGLFDYNVDADDFSKCFYNCTRLASVPSGLFVNNIIAKDFSSCFYPGGYLTNMTVHIGSPIVNRCGSFVKKYSSNTVTVYVPANSTTYTTFSNQASTLGITVIGE